MGNEQFAELLKRLDKMSDQIGELVVINSKPEPIIRKIVNGIATGVTILGILGIIETIKMWFGG